MRLARLALVMRLARLALVVGLAAAVGCASLFEPPVSREEQQAFDRAAAAAGEDPAGARAVWEQFLQRHPGGALAGDASLEIGRIAQRAGDAEEARRRYAAVVERGGSAADRARVQLATLELERGDAAGARRWLERVRVSRLEGPDRRNAYRALAESSERSPARVRWLTRLRSEVEDPAEVAAVDVELDGLLAELSPAELESTARYVGERPPAGRIHVVLAERAFAEGDLDAAREQIEAAKRLPLTPRYAPRLAAAISRLRLRSAGPTDVAELPTFREAMERPAPDVRAAQGALGVVLPLTGSYARFGEEALQGVLLAAGIFPESAGAAGPRVRIAVRDSGGDPARAAAAVRELAEDPEVAAIVGPLVSSACEAAAREAEQAGLPLLTLTAREDVVRGRRWVFRLRTRPIEEAQLLADRAVALGARRFGILYPKDAYGLGLRSLFWEAVEARGGEVVAVAAYDPEATDFADAIRRLVGYTLLDSEQKRLLASREAMLEKARRLPPEEARALRRRARSLTTDDGRPIPPIVDFEALFIPESHDNVVLIAPQLAFHEVTGVRLLGSDGWYGDDLVRIGGEHVEGALFAAHFFADSTVPYVMEFRRRFETDFGAEPDVFAAQAYDAAQLALLQLAGGARDREGVRDGILATESHPGVSGVLTMRADGNAHKRPFLLGVERGQVLHYVD